MSCLMEQSHPTMNPRREKAEGASLNPSLKAEMQAKRSPQRRESHRWEARRTSPSLRERAKNKVLLKDQRMNKVKRSARMQGMTISDSGGNESNFL
jgi:hypothetical protein